MDVKRETLSVTVPERHGGKRLDQTLALLCPQHSRARLQGWIKAGFVTVDGASLAQKDAVRDGQVIEINALLENRNENWTGQALPLDIIHEDEHLIVVNKPPGLVVHPGAGNPDRTLVNALLHHCPKLAQAPRAGIVQRLDKDTSGIMVVAKSLAAHTKLVKDLQARAITREYRALVHGELIGGGAVEAPIGRHPLLRTRMAVVAKGRPAITHYRIIGRHPGCTELKVTLETGRTHQIRVHLAHLGHPVVGDPHYGGRKRLAKNIPAMLKERLAAFPRQALHARRLALKHPADGKPVAWSAPLPEDLAALLEGLKGNAGAGSDPGSEHYDPSR